MEWIAIDDDGCVGVLRPRAGALVPRHALPRPDTFALDALCATRLIARGSPLPDVPRPSVGSRVLVVVDPMRGPTTYRDGPRERAIDADAVVVLDGPPRVVVMPPLDVARAAQLDRDPTIVRAIGERALRAWIAYEPDTGLFRFRAAGSTPDQYDRVTVPDDPIRIHELPTALQHAIRDVRFRARFARDASICRLDELDPAACMVMPETRGREPNRDARTRLALAFVVACLAHALLPLLVLR